MNNYTRNKENVNKKLLKKPAFPDVYKGRISSTVANLQAVLNCAGIMAQYDPVLKREIITFPDGEYRNESCCVTNIQSYCSQYGAPASIIIHLPEICRKNIVVPALSWIESMPWDRTNRLPALYNTLEVAPERQADRDMILHRWLIQAVAALDEAKQTTNPKAIAKYELILTLAGRQGLNKSNWLRSLLPSGLRTYMKGNVSLSTESKDSIIENISAWIIEWGEVDATFRKSDIAAIKAFMSREFDEVRMPYAPRADRYPRQTVYAASVNGMRFLTDTTGNRRYGAIAPISINCEHGLDMQQIWAQVWGEYLAGERWWLEYNEFDALNKHNLRFTKVNPIVDAIYTYIDVDASVNAPDRTTRMTLTQIKVICGLPGTITLSDIETVLKELGIKVKNHSRYLFCYVTLRLPSQQSGLPVEPE